MCADVYSVYTYWVQQRIEMALLQYKRRHTNAIQLNSAETRNEIRESELCHAIFHIRFILFGANARLERRPRKKKMSNSSPCFDFAKRLSVCASISTTNAAARKIKKKCIEINGFYTNRILRAFFLSFSSRTFLSALKATPHAALHTVYTNCLSTNTSMCSHLPHSIYRSVGWIGVGARNVASKPSNKNRQAHAKRDHQRM